MVQCRVGSEQRRLPEGVVPCGGGSGILRRSAVPPFEPKISQQFLDGRLPFQYFNFRGAVFELGPFHGIELIRRTGRCLREHTGRTPNGGYGSPNPACTSPPT